MYIVCEVEGGPEYDIVLKGESSKMAYNISTQSLQFGFANLDEIVEKEVVLYNSGKVPFDFNTELKDKGLSSSSSSTSNTTLSLMAPTLPSLPLFIVNPSKGVVKANDKQTIVVKYLARYPSVVQQAFKV